MEFTEVVRRRRMVRNYTPEPVPAAAVRRIVEAGLRAPSAGYTQGQAMIVVTDDETRTRIAALCGESEYTAMGFDPWISRAPVHIVVCTSVGAYLTRYREPDKGGPDSPLGKEENWPVPYWWVDAGATMQLLLLAAVDEGLAAGFLGAHAIGDLRDLLAIPGDHAPVGIVTIGHAAPDRRSGSLQRGRRRDAVHWEVWGA